MLRRELLCNLTPAELAVFSDELARLTTEETEIEAAKKEVVSEYGAKLQNCISARRLLATKISAKKEYRQVEVKWEKHFDQNCATLVRLDTYEVVDTRALTAEERQQELDLRTPDPEADSRQESIAGELETIQEELPVKEVTDMMTDENGDRSVFDDVNEDWPDPAGEQQAPEKFAEEVKGTPAFECKGCKRRKVKRICEECTA